MPTWIKGIWWYNVWKDNYVAYGNTGSDEYPSIVFVEGVDARNNYGVPVYSYTGKCIKCDFSISENLHFNPTDGGHYYLHCPNCLRWFRWLNPNGTVSDFAVVKSDKQTPLSINEYPGEPDWW